MELNRIALIGLALLTLARLLLLPSTELDPDEAYVALCAERPDWHYADSGPLPPLLSRIGTTLFGKNEFGHRVFAPLLALAMTAAAAGLALGIADGRAAGWTVLGLSVLPAMTIASTRLTVASCTACFWAVLIWAIWRALHSHQRRRTLWVIAGISGAACILCHPGNALLLVLSFLLLLAIPRWRRNLLNADFLIAAGIMLVGLLPLLLWDDGLRLLARIRWERALGMASMGPGPVSLGSFLSFVSACLAAYTPLLGFGLVWILVVDARKFRENDGARYAVAFSLPILVAGVALATVSRPDPLLLLPAAVPLLARLASAWPDIPVGGSLRVAVRSTALAFAALLSLIVSQTDLLRHSGMTWGFSETAPQSRGRTYWSPWGGDPSSMQRGWRELADLVGKLQAKSLVEIGERPFLIADSPEAAALLSFYLPDEAGPKGRGELTVNPLATPDPANSLLGWRRYDAGIAAAEGVAAFEGRHALFLSLGGAGDGVPRAITHAFGRQEPSATFRLIRGGERLRTVRVFACYDFHGLPL